jgi:hypothetical protein
MWVLLGVSNDTYEKETFVYFVGIFNDLTLAKNERIRLITNTKCDRNDYFINPVNVNTCYDYEWSGNEEDEIK